MPACVCTQSSMLVQRCLAVFIYILKKKKKKKKKQKKSIQYFDVHVRIQSVLFSAVSHKAGASQISCILIVIIVTSF